LHLEKSIPASEGKRKETISLRAKALVHFSGGPKRPRKRSILFVKAFVGLPVLHREV